MRERGIIFSGDMVAAALDDRKTQTRRVVLGDNGCAYQDYSGSFYLQDDLWHYKSAHGHSERGFRCPYGVVGDLLYVREAFYNWFDKEALYRATHKPGAWIGDAATIKWKPSIHMPKQLARIWFELTGVRVERIQDISGQDAFAEGTEDCHEVGHDDCFYGGSLQGYKCAFQRLWDSLNRKRGYGWDANPWCWVLSLKRIERKESDAIRGT